MNTKLTTESLVSLMEIKTLEALNEHGGVQGLLQELQTDSEKGITDLSSIPLRREKFGANTLPDPPTKTFFALFFNALKEPMLIILMISSIVALALSLAFPDPKDSHAWIDSVSILVAVLLVSLAQALTDLKQQTAFTAINKMKNDNPITVVRDSKRIKISGPEVVVGDILYLDVGNKIIGDGLYLSGRKLVVNESATTGESRPINIDETKPFLTGGSTVEQGDCLFLVLAVGVHTQTGAIFGDLAKKNEDDEKTPLEVKLSILAAQITWVGVAGSLLTFFVLLVKWILDVSKVAWDFKYLNVLVRHFIQAVTIFVCAVPEGLPLAVTISLSYSMSRMMEDNNFVRKLKSCETMGGASNICSDKTGTLTTNKMTVTQFYYGGKDYNARETPEMPKEVRDIFGIGVSVNSKGKVSKDEKGLLVYDGKSTECALVLFVEGMGYAYEKIRKDYPSLEIFDFDSDRKRMSTVINYPQNSSDVLINVKGAPEVVIQMCTKFVAEDGSIQPITPEFREQLNTQLLNYSKQMLRGLLMAYRIGGDYSNPTVAESDLVMIGVAALEDPLRDEVPDAIKQCHTAGVTVRMVTGDNIETAKAIASRCGILTEEGICLSGNEFRKMPETDLIQILPKLQVLARSTPRDKFRLVRILKQCGEVVAVTGDGTNDALALNTADVGLSMGMTGTEIAKEASDIVILDDNFRSIMRAMMWGRCVFDNVRRFLQFQLTVNVSALIISFLGAIIFETSPLKPVQLLWVNLIMDSFGALALATEKPRDYLLHRPPYGRTIHLLNNYLLINIVGQSIYQIALLLTVLLGGQEIWPDLLNSKERHYTMVFNAFVYCQIFNLLNSRVVTKQQGFFDGILSNGLFIIIFLGIFIVQYFIVEFGGEVFDTVPLTINNWISCIIIGFFSLIVGAFLRALPVTEVSYESVEAERKLKYEAVLESLRGLTEDEMWRREAEENERLQNESNTK